MPCYDHRNSHDYIEEHEIKPLRKRVDELAALLCEALQIIEGAEDTGGPAIKGASKELQQWWREHKEFDRKRGARK